jgi:hypothetical protein
VSRRLRIVAIVLCASSVYATSAFEPKTQALQTFELEQKLVGGVAVPAREWILVGNGRPDPRDSVQASASNSAKTYKRKFSTCSAVQFNPQLTESTNGAGVFNPLGVFNRYVQDQTENRNILFSLNYKDAKVRVIQQPKHATLTLDTSPQNFNLFLAIRHDKEYFGRDKAVFEIEYKGELYRMDYSVHYTGDNLNEQEQRRCSPRLRTVSAVDSWQDLGHLQLQKTMLLDERSASGTTKLLWSGRLSA